VQFLLLAPLWRALPDGVMPSSLGHRRFGDDPVIGWGHGYSNGCSAIFLTILIYIAFIGLFLFLSAIISIYWLLFAIFFTH
jgi:hypothetical protein